MAPMPKTWKNIAGTPRQKPLQDLIRQEAPVQSAGHYVFMHETPVSDDHSLVCVTLADQIALSMSLHLVQNTSDRASLVHSYLGVYTGNTADAHLLADSLHQLGLTQDDLRNWRKSLGELVMKEIEPLFKETPVLTHTPFTPVIRALGSNDHHYDPRGAFRDSLHTIARTFGKRHPNLASTLNELIGDVQLAYGDTHNHIVNSHTTTDVVLLPRQRLSVCYSLSSSEGPSEELPPLSHVFAGGGNQLLEIKGDNAIRHHSKFKIRSLQVLHTAGKRYLACGLTGAGDNAIELRDADTPSDNGLLLKIEGRQYTGLPGFASMTSLGDYVLATHSGEGLYAWDVRKPWLGKLIYACTSVRDVRPLTINGQQHAIFSHAAGNEVLISSINLANLKKIMEDEKRDPLKAYEAAWDVPWETKARRCPEINAMTTLDPVIYCAGPHVLEVIQPGSAQSLVFNTLHEKKPPISIDVADIDGRQKVLIGYALVGAVLEDPMGKAKATPLDIPMKYTARTNGNGVLLTPNGALVATGSGLHVYSPHSGRYIRTYEPQGDNPFHCLAKDDVVERDLS